MNSSNSGTQTEFTCICGNQKNWIGKGQTTPPCPVCGRKYLGYEKVVNDITEILAKEIK